jgi:hypothetical protein
MDINPRTTEQVTMRRKRTGPFEQAATNVLFALDAWSVVTARLARIAAGGPKAWSEMQRMTAEKMFAAWEAQVAAGAALATGRGETAARRKAAAVYRRRVRANRRRLLRRT